MIPKREFDSILRNHGHTVILQRRKFEHESGPYCEISGGRYNPVAEAWTAWRRYSGSIGASFKQDFLNAFGLTDETAIIFYLQAEALPKTGDLIREETPHELEGHTVYRVDTAIPYYDGGTLVYFAAHSKLLDPMS